MDKVKAYWIPIDKIDERRRLKRRRLRRRRLRSVKT